MATGDKLVNLDDLKVTYDKQKEDINLLKSAIGTVPSGKTVQGQIDENTEDISGLESETDSLKSAIGTVPSGKTVQGQIDENTEDISELERETDSLKSALESCSWIWGYYGTDGAFHDNNSFKALVDYVVISKISGINIKAYNNVGTICYYDANFDFISVQTASGDPVVITSLTVPTGAVYARFCYFWSDQSILSITFDQYYNAEINDKYVLSQSIECIRNAREDIEDNLGGLTTEYDGSNILNSAIWTDGYYYNYSNGAKWANADYCYSTLLACRGNEQLSLTITGVHTCFYDVDREYISGTTNEEIITPSSCKYIRVSIQISAKSTAVLYRYSSTEEKQATGNLAYKTRWIDGKFYYNGAETTNSEWCLSREFIKVKPGTNYYIGNVGSFIIGEYGETMNYLSQIANNSWHSFQTSSNTYYLRISIPIVSKSAFKLSENFPDILECGAGKEFENLNYASLCQIFCEKPIYLYPGNYDVSGTESNNGIQLSGDLIGIGNPRIYAELNSFNVNFSPINLRRKKIKVSGVTIECDNSRYCIHDEMGGSNTDGVEHIIENCILIQNTAIQEGFTYPRSIGVGIGNHETLIIENCKCYSNTADSDIDIHTNYEGQDGDSYVIVKGCWTKHTISASAVNNTGNGAMIILVSGNCTDRTPFANNPSYNTIDFEEFGNTVR